MMLLLLAGALYTGNGSCEPCHAEIVRSYSSTPMAQSSGRVAGGLAPGELRHAASGTRYSINADGDVHAANPAGEASWRLAYFIGSGATGRSFLTIASGFLFQAPVTWYTQQAKWDVSPGYETDTVSRWSRAVEPECLACHSSQIRFAKGYQNLYADPPFAQDGVGCERCHGPGSEHIAGRAHLVNPATLPAAQRDSVCAQCHMSGEARINRAGKSFLDYRPGDNLSSLVAYFVSAGDQAVRATSYVERLAASRCKAASGDALWCGSCHDPHRVPDARERVAYYQAKCLTCHDAGECRRGPDCAACHMPKSPVQDVAHGVLTDHAILKRGMARTEQTKPDWHLRGFSAADTGARELGLAYAEVSSRTRNPRQSDEAFRLLNASEKDEAVQIRLAALLQGRGEPGKAAELYASVLRQNPDSIVALVNLGNYYGSQGDLARAAAFWRRALTRNPCQPESAANLEKVYAATGEREKAKLLRQSQGRCVLGIIADK